MISGHLLYRLYDNDEKPSPARAPDFMGGQLYKHFTVLQRREQHIQVPF